MSPVEAIRNATQMLTAEEREHIKPLIENLKAKLNILNLEAAKHDRESKSARAKRDSLVKKLVKIDPHFEDTQQSYQDLETLLANAKSQKSLKEKNDKKRARLQKKWTNSGFEGDCPNLDIDALDQHIKDMIKKQREDKLAHNKAQNALVSIENKRKKLFDKLTESGLTPPESATHEELLTFQKQHNAEQKAHEKNQRDAQKFRNQLNKLISDNPDAGILDLPHDANPSDLENAVKQARETRDNFRKTQKNKEKESKALERANKKADSDKKKLEAKEQKLADKEAGIKGKNKNEHYQLFAKWIAQEIELGRIDQSDVDTAGGKGKYNSQRWKELTQEQKIDPTAAWNIAV